MRIPSIVIACPSPGACVFFLCVVGPSETRKLSFDNIRTFCFRFLDALAKTSNVRDNGTWCFNRHARRQLHRRFRSLLASNMIYSLYIINKAGGLVYQKDFTNQLEKLSSNEYLVLAGTFHGVHAITSKISPLHNSSGIEMLEAENFKLYCNQTLTGTKFLLITAPQQNNVDSYMKKIYDTYSDFVMKNPFHTPEMPIRSDQFDQSLLKFINNNATA